MREPPGLAILAVIHSRYVHSSCICSFPGVTRKMLSTFCLIMPYSFSSFFTSLYCSDSRSRSSSSFLYSALSAYRLGELLHPGLFKRPCRRLIQRSVGFHAPPERGLVFGLLQFQRHGPELLCRRKSALSAAPFPQGGSLCLSGRRPLHRLPR